MKHESDFYAQTVPSSHNTKVGQNFLQVLFYSSKHFGSSTHLSKNLCKNWKTTEIWHGIMHIQSIAVVSILNFHDCFVFVTIWQNYTEMYNAQLNVTSNKMNQNIQVYRTHDFPKTQTQNEKNISQFPNKAALVCEIQTRK